MGVQCRMVLSPLRWWEVVSGDGLECVGCLPAASRPCRQVHAVVGLWAVIGVRWVLAAVGRPAAVGSPRSALPLVGSRVVAPLGRHLPS